MKYVDYPICFKPHILLDKIYTFLNLSVTPRRLLFMEI